MRTSRGMVLISLSCAILFVEVGCASSDGVQQGADRDDNSSDPDSHSADDIDTEAIPPLDTESIVNKLDTFWGSAPPEATSAVARK